jgi:hypothetical protein
MHETKDDDWRQPAGIRHVGKALAIGNLSAVSDAIAETTERFWKTEAKLKETLADLSARIDHLEAGVRDKIKAAEQREAASRRYRP